MRALRSRGSTVGAIGAVITAVFAVLVVYSLVYPAVNAHQEKSRMRNLAEQALPPGAALTGSGVGGSGNGRYVGVASGHSAKPPADVLADYEPPVGALGWTEIPDCDKATRCYLSRGKDLILTLKVQPCIERGCPSGGTLIDTEALRGGPNS